MGSEINTISFPRDLNLGDVEKMRSAQVSETNNNQFNSKIDVEYDGNVTKEIVKQSDGRDNVITEFKRLHLGDSRSQKGDSNAKPDLRIHKEEAHNLVTTDHNGGKFENLQTCSCVLEAQTKENRCRNNKLECVIPEVPESKRNIQLDTKKESCEENRSQFRESTPCLRQEACLSSLNYIRTTFGDNKRDVGPCFIARKSQAFGSSHGSSVKGEVDKLVLVGSTNY